MESIIRQWYSDAADLLHYCCQLRDVGCRDMTNTIVDCGDELTQKQKAKLDDDLLKLRRVTADLLDKARETLISKTGSLRHRLMNHLSPRLEYAYAELPSFELTGLTPGHCLWPVFEDLCGLMRQWTQDMLPYWADEKVCLDFKKSELMQKLQSECPFTEERLNKMLERIRLENSRLLRDLKDLCKTTC